MFGLNANEWALLAICGWALLGVLVAFMEGQRLGREKAERSGRTLRLSRDFYGGANTFTAVEIPRKSTGTC